MRCKDRESLSHEANDPTAQAADRGPQILTRNLRTELLGLITEIDTWREEVREKVGAWKRRLKHANEHETPWTEITQVYEEMEAFLVK